MRYRFVGSTILCFLVIFFFFFFSWFWHIPAFRLEFRLAIDRFASVFFLIFLATHPHGGYFFENTHYPTFTILHSSLHIVDFWQGKKIGEPLVAWERTTLETNSVHLSPQPIQGSNRAHSGERSSLSPLGSAILKISEWSDS